MAYAYSALVVLAPAAAVCMGIALERAVSKLLERRRSR